jgi:hypothetical protein
LSLSPTQAAAAALTAYKASPGGGLTGVSVPNDANAETGGPLSRIVAITNGFLKSAAQRTIDVLSPANVFVPGGADAARMIARTAQNSSESVKNVTSAAGAGIKKGFTMAAFILTAVIGVYLWSIFRPARR